MGYSYIKQNDDTKYNLMEYVCDTVADVNMLPTDVSPGSSAIVVATSEVYMLNTNGEWKKL